MPEGFIVSSFAALLQQFAPAFTSPSFASFGTLASGWVLRFGRHTVTGVVRAAHAVGTKHISSFHRFFREGRWCRDEVGLLLVRLVEPLVGPDEPLIVALDDTLGRHTGKRISAASMHRDPLLSTAMKPAFHWGHIWVVLAINVRAFDKTWSLPVLVRLFRSRHVCARDGRAYRTQPELAAELVRRLAEALPAREIVVVCDAAFTNSGLVRGRPANVTVIGRSRLDAAIYAPAPLRRRGQIGRPRVRGRKLPSPAAQAKRGRWQRVRVHVYSKTVTVQVLVIDALWYIVGHSEPLRLVVVRGFPGHDRDDCFVATDRRLEPREIIERFSQRWALEVTFHECKGRLGFEHPQNRTEGAVERTAPMALWSYTLVVVWYVTIGHRRSAVTSLPWYRKTAPAFSDMLGAVRRASWAERLLDPRATDPTTRKHLRAALRYFEPLADAA